MALLKKLFDYDEKELRRFTKMADKIIELEDEYSKLSDDKLKKKTEEFKKRLEEGETFDDIIIEAFATAREACYRVIGEKPFKVQLIGGLALHYGNIAEMKTGEGKTLTSVMPAYLNALEGKSQSRRDDLESLHWIRLHVIFSVSCSGNILLNVTLNGWDKFMNF